MTQTLRPSSDVGQSGSWEREPVDGALLWNTIDEVTANDADYVWHDAVSGTEYFEVHLSDPLGTPTTGAIGSVTIYWRVARIDGGTARNITCELRQGAAVKGSDQQAIADGTPVTYDFTNSVEVTDFTDLRLRFTVT